MMTQKFCLDHENTKYVYFEKKYIEHFKISHTTKKKLAALEYLFYLYTYLLRNENTNPDINFNLWEK